MLRSLLFFCLVIGFFFTPLMFVSNNCQAQSGSQITGDFDKNCQVNLVDLYWMGLYWLRDCGDPNWCEGVDINQSTNVDIIDYSLFSNNWKIESSLNLDKNNLYPLETLNITVDNVQHSCIINVTTPAGIVHSFSGAISEGQGSAGYIPSYLPGTYQVEALADGCPAGTDEFNVPLGNTPINIQNWQAVWASYYPARDITFTNDLKDPCSNALTGFSGQTTDTRYDSNSGRLSILRKITEVAEDGTITARVFLYFDTTGSWSNIYAGTVVNMSVYYKDGTVLPGDFTLANGTENGGGYITNELIKDAGIDKFNTSVVTGFSGVDRISYLDVIIPPGRNLSEVIFSVDYIKYYYNTGWADRIYIAEKYVNATGSGFELSTGSNFSTLGRLPIYLPLTPNENGLVYYSIHTDHTIGETNLNKGTISEVSGSYSNVWTWNDYIDTQARVYLYADKWGHSHDFTEVIQLEIDPGFNQTGLVMENYNADSSTYFPDENIKFSFDLKDGLSNSVTGFTGTISDSVPNNNGGALYILRKILNVEEDGSAQARLYLYFDTTGSWSNIYAGTSITISLYDKDGITPLTGAVSLSTGFINNDPNELTTTLIGNAWQVQVVKNFVGNDKIAYLDFDMPAGMAISEVVFSVDNIKYNRNSGWGDKIIIAGKTAGESNFPKTYTGAIEFQTGNPFPGLGKFPLILSLNPNPNGFIFYKLDSADIDENNINYGSLSEAGGAYNNSFKWNDYIVTTAKVYPYVDKWWYNSAAGAGAVNLSFEGTTRELAIYNYDLDSRSYSLNDTRQLTASVIDGYSNPISGFKLKDSVTNSNNGKLSIVTQNVGTTPDPNNIVRLLLYFDTTGSWSDIYANTEIGITLYGPDGKTGVPPEILIVEGGINAEDYFVTSLTESAGVYTWNVRVDKNINQADRQVYLDFVVSDEVSSSKVIFSVDHIKYFCNTGWADSITIRNQTLSQGSFGRNYAGQFEFTTGDKFGSLGRFPLYLTLNPGGSLIFPQLQTDEDAENTGTMSESSGDYTYSHQFTIAGKDYNTALKIGKFGYFDNEYRSTESIWLYFSGEPRYLGGLEDQPVPLNTTWQVDLDEHFFVEEDYNNVEYSASEPNVTITGNIARFTPDSTDDTLYDLVITAQSTVDPCKTASSDPFTLYAATCSSSYDCVDDDPNVVNACVLYQCVSYEPRSSYQLSSQGVDLNVLNKDIIISDPFPDPNDQVHICAAITNTGTTNIYDVDVKFYLDDVNSTPISTQTIDFLPITYMSLPFSPETVCFDWQVPGTLRGAHRLWVEVSADFLLEMEEDMFSNNYATLDFFVNEPNELDTLVFGSCTVESQGNSPDGGPGADESEKCYDLSMLIPIKVQVCEDEIICGPVTGYELSYWSTIYWPSWSGYCQEFGVPQEAITDFIRTYEVIVTLGMSPSLSDVPGALKAPFGWGDGWLPCHPEPSLFPSIVYRGVGAAACGGLCPVSAWDCGSGVSFQPRFSSPYYHAYAFRVSGGARKVTRCYTEMDYIEVPYQICFPTEPVEPNLPFTIPFTPFGGGPGGGGGGYGGNGISGPGTGPGGGPPIKFELGPPTDPNGDPLTYNGNPLDYTCYFCSTGTSISNSTSDYIYCGPNTGGAAMVDFSLPITNSISTMSDYQYLQPAGAEMGQTAPDFTLATVEGEKIALSDLRGEQVLLVFGNTQCPHCRDRIPFLNELDGQTEGETYKVLFIAVGATSASVKKYVEDNNISFDVLVDAKGRVGRKYNIKMVPEVFLVDPEGIIKYNSIQQGQVVWYYLADSVKSETAIKDNQIDSLTLSQWAGYGLYDTFANPRALIEDFNQDQKLDILDFQVMAMKWLLQDQQFSPDTGCVFELKKNDLFLDGRL